MNHLLMSGFFAGVIGSVIMLLVTLPVAKGSTSGTTFLVKIAHFPTDNIITKYGGIVASFIYGGIAGSIFAYLINMMHFSEVIVLGLVWGLVLMALGHYVWSQLLGTNQTGEMTAAQKTQALFIELAGYLLYGAVAGFLLQHYFMI